tara:strand:+ start:1096 stop:1410 length:315 start_codon:yes stop_codon:yes gene_type:complete
MLDSAFVSRNLMVAIRDWNAWLANQAMSPEDWRGVPPWCKTVASRLDVPWALHDLERHAENRGMIQALFRVVDEIYMACELVEGVPDISRLRNELMRWHEENYG